MAIQKTKRIKYEHILGKPVRQFRAYASYMDMIARCYDPNHRAYRHYGGRGIEVCSRWKESFISFLDDMGDRPKRKTLDRKNNDGNYTPENCRWATYTEQLRNTRGNVRVTYQGKTLCLSEWAELYGLDYYNVFHHRINRGWSFERALTTPAGRYTKRGDNL